MMKPFKINEKKVDVTYAITTRTTKMKITKSIIFKAGTDQMLVKLWLVNLYNNSEAMHVIM